MPLYVSSGHPPPRPLTILSLPATTLGHGGTIKRKAAPLQSCDEWKPPDESSLVVDRDAAIYRWANNTLPRHLEEHFKSLPHPTLRTGNGVPTTAEIRLDGPEAVAFWDYMNPFDEPVWFKMTLDGDAVQINNPTQADIVNHWFMKEGSEWILIPEGYRRSLHASRVL